MLPSNTVFHGRVVLIGDASVGKTSILNVMTKKSFNESENSTVGANYQLLTKDVDDVHVEIQLWDTAGQEKFRSLGPVYFRNSIGSIIVFDLTNRRSYNNLNDWIEAFVEVAGHESLIIIAGNKSDLSDTIEVFDSEVNEWASSHGYFYFKTSARTGEGINELFDFLSKELVKTKVMTTAKYNLAAEHNQSNCC